jgi:glucose/arabinose dehydrogenase
MALPGCADEDRAAAPATVPAEPARAQEEAPEARPAQRRRRGVRLRTVGRFEAPVYVTAPPRDRRRLFVVERGGTVRIVRGGRRLARPFLDVSRLTTTDGERGLLSIAFPPDYARSGRVYAYYTDRRGAIRLDEWRRSRASADRVNAGSRRTVLVQPHGEFSNHNGGQVQFARDGLLYFAIGDGGGGGDPLESAQDLGTLLGKMGRIDPRRDGGRAYRVPSANPYRGRSGARSEIYASGLRNPFRFSFDRRTGDLVIADQGQDTYEEVNFLPRGRGRGANLGWDVFEGRHPFESGSAPGALPPTFERAHAQGWCSITGGYVVRDRALAGLYGRYVYGDLCRRGLRSVRLTRAGARGDRAVGVSVSSLASFGEDGRGRVHAVSLEGPVYRLAPR